VEGSFVIFEIARLFLQNRSGDLGLTSTKGIDRGLGGFWPLIPDQMAVMARR
jgi:hypothetical protein